MHNSITLRFAVCLLATAACLAAAPIVYNSRAAFDAATTTSLITFEAQNPGGPNAFAGPYTNLVVGSVTFNQPDDRLYVIGQQVYPTTGLTSSYLNHNDLSTGNVTISFASAMNAVGFDFGFLDNWEGSGNAVLSLSNGDVFSVAHPKVGDTGLPLMFWGVTTDTAFTSIVINDPTKGTVIDNFAYGSASASVPDSSSTIALLGAALIGMVAAARRRRA